MIIDLQTMDNARVIDAVLGQMSDGMWENSPSMDKYWMNAEVHGTELEINTDTWNSGFRGKSEEQIRSYFAKKIKQVVQEEVGGNKEGWKRENTDQSCYMHDIEVSKCYKCYDYLLGRMGHTYGHEEI